MARIDVSVWMKDSRDMLRDTLIGKRMQDRLLVEHVSIVSSDCTGGRMYHDLGLRFDSPFINMFLSAEDYIRVVNDLEGYLSQLLIAEENIPGFGYPLARLGDVLIHLVHYDSFAVARKKWDERLERFDFSRPLYVMNDRNGFQREHGVKYASAVRERGVLYTHVKLGLEGDINEQVVAGCADMPHVPIMTSYRHKLSLHRNYDCFDFVGWINNCLAS